MSRTTAAHAQRAMPILDAVTHTNLVERVDRNLAGALKIGHDLVIQADDAFGWYMKDHAKGLTVSVDMSDLANVAPPALSVWVEGQVEAQSLVTEEHSIERAGISLTYFDLTNPAFPHDRRFIDWANERAGEMDPEPRWAVVAVTTVRAIARGRPSFHVSHTPTVVWIDASGCPVGWHCPDLGDDIPEGPGFYDARQAPGLVQLSPFGACLALVAVQFLHARNVQTIERTQRATSRGKKSKRGDLPAHRYHVLDVTGMRKAYIDAGRDAEAEGAARAALAMHTVRGHFKTYTAQKPLLGRHVGSYFWGFHVRGTTADRVVEKAYHPAPEKTS